MRPPGRCDGARDPPGRGADTNRAVRDDNDIAWRAITPCANPVSGALGLKARLTYDIAGTGIAGTDDLEGRARARSGRALPVCR
jgi:hypothetical protein